MSESGRTPFGDRASPAAGSLSIAADSAGMVQLLNAAGWPPRQIVRADSPFATTARIHAFDCRSEVPVDDAFADVPSDAGLLCLVSLETVDRVDMLLHGRTSACVFGDDPALIAIALSDLGAMLQSGRAFDSNRAERARLQALAMELARLAEQLGDINAIDDAASDGLAERSLSYRPEPAPEASPSAPPDALRIRHLISIRRMRDRFFSPELFADPAWDILLDLAASRLERRAVSVSSLCIAAAVPPTTALRWIRMMTDQQLLERRADPLDARRMFVELSNAAFAQLCAWFALVDARGGTGLCAARTSPLARWLVSAAACT